MGRDTLEQGGVAWLWPIFYWPVLTLEVPIARAASLPQETAVGQTATVEQATPSTARHTSTSRLRNRWALSGADGASQCQAAAARTAEPSSAAAPARATRHVDRSVTQPSRKPPLSSGAHVGQSRNAGEGEQGLPGPLNAKALTAHRRGGTNGATGGPRHLPPPLGRG